MYLLSSSSQQLLKQVADWLHSKLFLAPPGDSFSLSQSPFPPRPRRALTSTISRFAAEDVQSRPTTAADCYTWVQVANDRRSLVGRSSPSLTPPPIFSLSPALPKAEDLAQFQRCPSGAPLLPLLPKLSSSWRWQVSLSYALLVDVMPFQKPALLYHSLARAGADSPSPARLCYPEPTYPPLARAQHVLLPDLDAPLTLKQTGDVFALPRMVRRFAAAYRRLILIQLFRETSAT